MLLCSCMWGPRAERRAPAAHAQCTVGNGPERLKVWGGGSKLLPRLGCSGKGYRGADLAGGGMRRVTRLSPP